MFNQEEFEILKKDALENHIPIIMDDTLEKIKEILGNEKPKRILEIGTAVGYSASCFVKYSDEDVVVDGVVDVVGCHWLSLVIIDGLLLSWLPFVFNHSSKVISGSPLRLRSRQVVAYCRRKTDKLYSDSSLSIFGFTNPQARVRPSSPSNCGTIPLCPYSSIATSSRPLSASGNNLIGPRMSK